MLCLFAALILRKFVALEKLLIWSAYYLFLHLFSYGIISNALGPRTFFREDGGVAIPGCAGVCRVRYVVCACRRAVQAE